MLPNQYTADVDDQRAQRIANQLPQWGEALFDADAVFLHRAAQRLLNDFQDQDEPGKLPTISTSHLAIFIFALGTIAGFGRNLFG